MKERWLKILARLGHFQAQLLLVLVFVIFLVPYALLMRLFGEARLPQGKWQRVEPLQDKLEQLRRTF